MTQCNNADCLCQGVESKDFRHLSNRDLDQRFGAAVARLQQAREDIVFLQEFVDHPEKLVSALEDLDVVITELTVEHEAQAAVRGFTIRGGIGPGDWRRK